MRIKTARSFVYQRENSELGSASQMSDNMRKRARLHRGMATNMLSMKDLDGEENDPVTMFARAKLLEKESKFEEAIEEYKRALEIDPNFVNAVYSKAACES